MKGKPRSKKVFDQKKKKKKQRQMQNMDPKNARDSSAAVQQRTDGNDVDSEGNSSSNSNPVLPFQASFTLSWKINKRK